MRSGRTTGRAAPATVATIVALVALAGSLQAPGSAVAAPTPAPAWEISALEHPTFFAPGTSGNSFGGGPLYMLAVTNAGGAAASGATITDTLPAGLSLAPGGAFGRELKGFVELSCSGAGQSVECTAPGPVPPGAIIEMGVPVEVSSTAPEGSTVTNEATASGGGAAPASTTVQTTISSALSSFDFAPGESGAYGSSSNVDGTAATQAGSHPFQYTIGLDFTSYLGANGEPFASGGGVRGLEVQLPPGVVVNPNATPTRCTEAQLVTASCPQSSIVGTIENILPISARPMGATPLFNMVAPRGKPAEFGFEIAGNIVVHLFGRVRSDGDYSLVAAAPETIAKVPVLSAQTTLWGNPTGETHDPMRFGCHENAGAVCPIPEAERTGKAFLTMPSACSGPLTTMARAASWEEPGVVRMRSFASEDLAGNPVGVSGCSSLEFEPTITLRPSVGAADSPTGLDVDLHIPQSEQFEDAASEPLLAAANLRDTRVTLPPGLVVNPSSANGLDACSPAQVGLTSGVGQTPTRFTAAPATCPGASKIGSVEVDTPLLDHPLPGAVYIATPDQNPFGSLLAIYVAIHDPQTDVVIKLAGHVQPDPTTGQLTATFRENPQLPFEDFRLDFFGGERGALRTPATCGAYTSRSELTPWSGTPQVPGSDAFEINQGPNGGACASAPGQLPHAPAFEAGTLSPIAAAYSPFVLHLRRGDGSQELGAIDTTLPPGLAGKLAGIPYCPDSALAAAAGRDGRDEQASSSCPPGSQVGSVVVAAGAGSQPFHVRGEAYLAGPYKGAPVSLAIVTPAVAGPFDLGTVVVRAALLVNPETAQITARSDPIPRILQGIPLDVRSIALTMDRPEFTLNPTSCETMAVGGSAASVLGQAAPLASRFQVGGCRRLAFRPKLFARLFGPTRRSGHPRLRAIVIARRGEANISRAAVALPHSEFLDQAHIKTICTRVQFAADQCPAASVYGHAKALTPLLDEPLRGPVYLRSSSHELPDLVAALRGPPSQPIEIDLAGRIDSVRGGIRNTFETVPDAPVTKFILTMRGGRKGLLVNSRNLCKGRPGRVTARFGGQNGKRHGIRPLLRNDCGKRPKARPRGRR